MGHVYLVRHGQASFGADNYDQLSPLGAQQAQALGQYWHARGMRFDAVYTGSLQRHQQTLAQLSSTLPQLPAAHTLEALNEYDSHALIRCLHPGPLPPADTPETYRAHFRLLCDALAQWMSGVISPEGMPSWAEFSGGIRQTLERIRREHHDQQALIISSGGPISTAVAQILSAPAEVSIALNMRLRNCSITQFDMSPKRCMLVGFNALPHLDTDSTRSWQTLT